MVRMAVVMIEQDAAAGSLAPALKARMEAFMAEVTGVEMRHPVQRSNAEVYVRGLLAAGARKSLEPLVERLDGDGDYQSLQQFLADSPWDPGRLMQAVAERVAPVVRAEAWVLDDTGFPKDGKHSPGVKRQYSGTLGKIGNCQIGVSLHAVCEHATLPLGWALYLPQDWCADPELRRKAKIPEQVQFQTKPPPRRGPPRRSSRRGPRPRPCRRQACSGRPGSGPWYYGTPRPRPCRGTSCRGRRRSGPCSGRCAARRGTACTCSGPGQGNRP